EKIMEGRVPLHTLRANIDFAIGEANTTFGKIGVKVWIYKGEEPLALRSERARGAARPAGAPAPEQPAEGESARAPVSQPAVPPAAPQPAASPATEA
ncbi:MAG: 30S ribosomal protein S3, partial [Chloroflexi bacterium]|nr:30S ribosomal protein S3 [Chloroflexota bacterium]